MRQLHQALALADRGDRQGALGITLQLLERNPRFVAAIKLKGTLLEETGQPSDAAATFEEGLKLAPNDPDMLLKSGIYKLAAGDRNEALKLLRQCARILPSDGDVQFYLAQAYHLTGQDKSALPAIKKSLEAEPDNPSVWQKYGELLCSTGDCEGGLRWLVKAQHADASLPRIDYDIAATEYKRMDLVHAEQYAQRAVGSEPNNVNAWQLLAAVDVKLTRWQEAQRGFERILAIKNSDVDAMLGLGQCEVELKNYDKAIATLESVLRLDPTRLLAHFYLSRAYAALGRAAEAQHEAALHQLMMEQLTFVRTKASDERERAIKAEAQKLLTAHHEAGALHLYQQHFKGTSDTAADAYVFVGKLYLFMGQMDNGERCLHHALKIQPNVRGAHTYEGILALKLGDLNQAEKEFQAELANDPNYQMAIAELGEVRYHQQRWSEAAELLAKSKTMTPELLYMLCDADFHLGKVDDADLNAEAMAAYARGNPQLMNGLFDLLNRNGQAHLAARLEENSAN
jgi:tetratricopeptide (TPR) repeat protein